MRRLPLGLVACLVLATGCRAPVFQCQADDQCSRDGGAGTCEPNGFCSFEDAECPTQRRYGNQAPDGLAGLCVEPTDSEPETSGGCVGAACGTTAPETSSPTSGPMTSSSTEPDPSSGGDALEPSTGSSTGSESGDPEPSGSSTSGDTTTTGAPVCPEFFDDFDNGIVDEDPWQVFDGTGLMSEVGDTVRFSIDPSQAFYSFLFLSDVDVTTGYVSAHLVALPQDPSSEFILRVFDAGGLTGVEFSVTGDRRISARVNGAATTEFIYPLDVAALWLELAFDGTNVAFNFSTDGSDYTELESVPTPLRNPGTSELSMAGGSFAPIASDAHTIEIDRFEYCSGPEDG